MLKIKNLLLNNFRNFDSFEIPFVNSAINLIVGPNGSGKTSILEAISIIAPGKGLKNADFDEIIKYGSNSWSLESLIENDIGIFNVSAEYQKSKKGKSLYVDELKTSNAEINKIFSVISLTPQMNSIFATISERRKLLDRLVYYFDFEHSSRIHRYEYYLKERMKLLEQSEYDKNWIDIIEDKIAEASIQIADARMRVLALLKSIIEEMDTSFPKPIFDISGYVEQNIHKNELAEYIKKTLYQNRHEDLSTRRTNFGTHRSDFIVKFGTKDIRAEFCSTGEQKALLVSIILAKTLATIKIFGRAPIILLDEAITHLDKSRKTELITFLCNLKCQIWISSTEEEDFCGYDHHLIKL